MSIDDHRWKKQKMDCNVKVECSNLLKELMDRRLAWVFTKPVDLVKAPDYFKKIRTPMDLGTIKRNLERNMYSDAKEFSGDMLLTFRNAMLYHSPLDEVYRNARLLNCNFKRRWEILAKKMKLDVDNSNQVMKPAAGPMKAPKAEKRGYSRRVSLEKKLKLGAGIKNEKTLNGCTSLRKNSDKGVNRCQEAAIDAYTRGAVPIEEKSPCSTSSTTPTSAAEGVQMSPKKASRVAMLKGRFAEMASRERERKAARMALGKIKKTVEIDTSPILLKEMSILFGCYSNPKALEKIGFYLKQNYVEEYEV
ncbi:transcription factor GTE12-like [Salvia splendens]|nr:transcription factor GTE12-like [Salvia splendens]